MRYLFEMTERGRAIVLIGFMGAGKTTVGRELALLTKWPLYDTDDTISARFGMPIADFFDSRGEETFRDAERDALATIPRHRAIVATGGGIVLRPENIATLRALGPVIYLEADESTLFARVASGGERRPLLETEDPRATLAHLLRAREPLYRAAADLSVDTTRFRPAEAAQAIVRHVG